MSETETTAPTNYHDPNRQVGRSTVSLRHALELAMQGRDVAFITATLDTANLFQDEVMYGDTFAEFRSHLEKVTKLRLRFKSGGTLRFITFQQDVGGALRGWRAVKIPDHHVYDVSSQEIGRLKNHLSTERIHHHDTKTSLQKAELENQRLLDLADRLRQENLRLRNAVNQLHLTVRLIRDQIDSLESDTVDQG